jgi:hypothetical protein
MPKSYYRLRSVIKNFKARFTGVAKQPADEGWLHELELLQRRYGASRNTQTTDQILEELREDRF